MTRLVAPDQQGQLQGATTSVQSVSQLLGPFLFTLTFAYFIGAQAPLTLPGAPFLLASAHCCCWRWRRARSRCDERNSPLIRSASCRTCDGVAP
jgi:hypothetical protein